MNILNLFKRKPSKLAVAYIEALRKNPERYNKYRWEHVRSEIDGFISDYDRKWMCKQRINIMAEYWEVKIAAIQLESEDEQINSPTGQNVAKAAMQTTLGSMLGSGSLGQQEYDPLRDMYNKNGFSNPQFGIIKGLL